MKIREVGQKAENLIEQGERAKQQQAYYQRAAASARSQLMAAYTMLEAASETDEDGNPCGNTGAARGQVYAAQAQLASAERGLSEAERALEGIDQEKRDTIRDVDRYIEGESRNLTALQQLQKKRFGGNADAFIADLVARMNSGQAAKDRLLQSMGQSPTGKRFTGNGAAGTNGAVMAHRAETGANETLGYGGVSPGYQPEYQRYAKRQLAAYKVYRDELNKIRADPALTPEMKAQKCNELAQQLREIAYRESWVKPCTGANNLMGVRFPDNISADSNYGNMLIDRIGNGEKISQRVFMKFAGNLAVADDNFSVPEAAAHYAPRSGFYNFSTPDEELILYEEQGVHLNAVDDMNNPRGAGTTFFHEIGHMIDHAACGYGNARLSDDSRFREALLKDGKKIIDGYAAMPEQKKIEFLAWLYKDQHHSLSDLLGGLSDHEVEGKYGHKREYWQSDPSNIFSEAFAHFYEASMGSPYKHELFKEYFPSAYARFFEVLESADYRNLTRVKSIRR